jgi:hypothetical protein
VFLTTRLLWLGRLRRTPAVRRRGDGRSGGDFHRESDRGKSDNRPIGATLAVAGTGTLTGTDGGGLAVTGAVTYAGTATGTGDVKHLADGRRPAATNQSAGSGVGQFPFRDDGLAQHHGLDVAVRALNQPPRTAGQVLNPFRVMQPEPL